jgi:U3 small nucleolar RNA-associated protein 18
LFNAQWAKRSAEDSDAPAALKSTNILFKGRRTAIDPDTIKIARARDANWVEYNQSIVTSLNWHQSGRVLMTAGLDKTVRLFNIDGNENEKLSSVFFKDLPILSSAFLPNSDEIILSGKRKHFYSYNTETGNILKVPSIAGREEREWPVLKASPDGKLICFRGLNGEMVLVSGKTKQLVHEIKMNGFVNDFAFSSDSSCLYSVGNDGEVYHWDLRNMSCFSRTTDIGARNPHCIAVSSNDMYMATGDESGIVNLYESFLSNSSLDSGLYIKPQLKRSIDNLTTSIQQISFNHDGQLLAMISRVKKDQCKIVHTATGRVYANWPTQSSPLGRLQCCQFSPNSGYLALGNDLGKVLLYRMLHYEKA